MGSKTRKVNAFLFDYENGFLNVQCKTEAGIASYLTGGFALDNKATLKNANGGRYWESGRSLNSRPSKPYYLVYRMSTAPLEFVYNESGIHKIIENPMNGEDFDKSEHLAAENGRIEGATKINGMDFILFSLAVLMIVMAIPPVMMGILLAIKEL